MSFSSSYPFQRGAAVVVNAGCGYNKETRQWEPEEALVDEFGRLMALLPDRNFTILKSLNAPSKPTAADIIEMFDSLAATDFTSYDALLVILMSHGLEGKMTAWPSFGFPLGQNSIPTKLDLRRDVYSKFQLPAPDSTAGLPTKASETLMGKPKIFITEMCRGGSSTITHPLGWAECPPGLIGLDGFKTLRELSEKGKPLPPELSIVKATYKREGDDGALFTRYADFLFAWSTVPFNPSGTHGAYTHGDIAYDSRVLFLSAFRELLAAQPACPVHELLTQANKKAVVKGHPQQADIETTLRRNVVLTRPHSGELTDRTLLGREVLKARLLEHLRSTQLPRYNFVVGSAGLGKTELVKHVARELAVGNSPFLAVIFVELRAKDTKESVLDAIETATVNALAKVGISQADQPAGAVDKMLAQDLLILDNADDPYKSESNTSQWFENLLVKDVAKRHGTILLTLRDEGKRSLFTKPCMQGMWQIEVTPLDESTANELIRHEMGEVKLSENEETRVREACGRDGASPLAITVVCGVLRYLFTNKRKWSGERRHEYLTQLPGLVARESDGDDFKDLQDVMRVSFNYLTDTLKSAFLKLHLFPDHFSQESAARVLNLSEKEADGILEKLIDFRLLTWNADHEGYLMLDHIWRFAAGAAEADGGKNPAENHDLSREDFADAVTRFMHIALDDNRLVPAEEMKIRGLPRLVRAALWRAKTIMIVLARHNAALTRRDDGADDDPDYNAANFRSLSSANDAEFEKPGGPCTAMFHESQISPELSVAAKELLRRRGILRLP